MRSRAFSGPWAGGGGLGAKARGAAALGAVGAAYVAVAHVPVQQALNAALSVLLFNLLYDVILR